VIELGIAQYSTSRFSLPKKKTESWKVELGIASILRRNQGGMGFFHCPLGGSPDVV